jgi:hypothetical protein
VSWQRILHGHPGALVEEVEHLATLASCPPELDAEGRRLFAAVWLGSNRHRDEVRRLVAVRVACCATGSFPAVAGVWRVPGVGLVIEESWTALRLDEATNTVTSGLPGQTQVLDGLEDATPIKAQCPECRAPLALTVGMVRRSVSEQTKNRRKASARLDIQPL